jgi:hypothetical protein
MGDRSPRRSVRPSSRRRAARYDRMAADAKRLADDPEDRALVAELQEFFGEV